MLTPNREFRLPNPRIYPYWRTVAWNLAALRYEFIVEGLENIPAPEGEVRGRDYYPEPYDPFQDTPVDTHAFVLAANHVLLTDIVAVGYLKRPFVLVGKPFFRMAPGVDVFFDANGLLTVFRPGIDDVTKHWYAHPFKPLLVPWRRRVSLTADEMIERAVWAAKMGIPVEIYPQGARDKKDKGLKGRFGAIQIAMEAGVPLIPAGIEYGDPQGVHRRQVAMVIGAPMLLPDCSFSQLTMAEKIALADAWEDEVRELRNQAKQLLER